MNTVNLAEIHVDGGTQPRAAIDQATVDEYAEAMARGELFPPLVVFFDGMHAWLADGFHRFYAAKKAGVQAVDVDWREGSLEQAKLHAAGANAAHGLRRTVGDKRRAIEMILSTEQGRQWTQEQIAQHCHVSQSWVSDVLGKYRSDNPQRNQQPKRTAREEKRAQIAAALTTHPGASNSKIARDLGVDRETVAAVRAALAGATSDQPAAQVAADPLEEAEPPPPQGDQRGHRGGRCAIATGRVHQLPLIELPLPPHTKAHARAHKGRKIDLASRWTPRHIWTLHRVPGRLAGPLLAVRRRVLSDGAGTITFETPGGTAKVSKDGEGGLAARGFARCSVLKLWVYDHEPTEADRAEWMGRCS